MKHRTELCTPYPCVPLDPHDFGVIEYPHESDAVRCVCGNGSDGMNPGYAALARETGRFALFSPQPSSDLDYIGTDPGLAVCHDCGRVYDDADLERGQVASFPVFRLDIEHDAVKSAIRAYWEQNGFGGWEL